MPEFRLLLPAHLLLPCNRSPVLPVVGCQVCAGLYLSEAHLQNYAPSELPSEQQNSYTQCSCSRISQKELPTYLVISLPLRWPFLPGHRPSIAIITVVIISEGADLHIEHQSAGLSQKQQALLSMPLVKSDLLVGCQRRLEEVAVQPLASCCMLKSQACSIPQRGTLGTRLILHAWNVM